MIIPLAAGVVLGMVGAAVVAVAYIELSDGRLAHIGSASYPHR